MILRGVVASIIGLGLIAVACQTGAQPLSAPPTAPPVKPTVLAITAPSEHADDGDAANGEHPLNGEELFANAGCAACHGEDATGTDIAPALTGHSVAQVKRQARAPIGIMPVFSPDKISNEELQEIGEYVAGLGGGHAHMREGVSGDELIMHHWMAIIALESGEIDEASHHIDHILEGAEGQHHRMMQQSQAFLADGEVHEAAHIIEEMLAGLDDADLDLPSMHMRLAISSLRGDNLTSAAHHVEHFTASADGEQRDSAQHIADDLMNGDLHEADEKMVLLLGGEMAADDHGEAGQDETEGHDDGDMHEEEMNANEMVDEMEGHDGNTVEAADKQHDEMEDHEDGDMHEEDPDAHDEHDEEAQEEAEEHDDDGDDH